MSLLGALGLAAAVGTAAKAGAGMYQAAQQFTDEDEARLRKLERLRALKELGMTEEEELRLERQLLKPIASGKREQQDKLMQSLSVQDVGATSAARQMAAIEAASQPQTEAAMAQVREQDRLRRLEQLAEIKALESQEKARKVGMVTAGLGGAADTAAAFAAHQQAKQQAANQEALMQLFQANEQAKQGSNAFLSDATTSQLMLLQLLK